MLLLAHRGLVAPLRPENTVEAVEAALRCGADGVEVDVRLSADGQLVASHDADLQRVAGEPVAVARTSWAALREVRLPGSTRLARLEDLLEAARGARVVVEVKPPPLEAGPPARTALAVAGLLRSRARHGREDDVVVSSRAPAVLSALAAAPDGRRLRTALVGGRGADRRALHAVARLAGCSEVHPHATTALGADPRALPVVPWVVDDPGVAWALGRSGVAGLMTDAVDVLAADRRALAASA